TIVFDNPSEIKKEIPIIQPARNLELSQATMIIFVGPPIAALVFIIVWAKWGDKLMKKKNQQADKKI
ncbi:MAG TPA: hypothetical protein VFP45_06465, partial [Candidatus Nitrosotalea sp.]|nr:hypothetical protein [Candidatus Nitrosotalea sp.]